MTNKELEDLTGLKIKDLSDKDVDKLKRILDDEYAMRRKKVKSKLAFFRGIWEIFGFDASTKLEVSGTSIDRKRDALSSTVYKLEQYLGYMCDITLGNYNFEPDGCEWYTLRRVAKEVPPELTEDYQSMADELLAIIRKYHKKGEV